MKKKFILLIFLFLVAIFAYRQKQNNVVIEEAPVYQSNFFMPERFWYGVNNAKLENYQPFYGGVLPHHLLAGRIISSMFESLKAQGVKKIIVVGPNHYEKDRANLQYGFNAWQTAFGPVKAFRPFELFPQVRQETMEAEHSVSGLVPYVKYYIPQALVFSVIIKHNTTDGELEELASRIVKSWDSDTVLLASVDFSHYLPQQVAEQRDKITREILLKMDEQSLYNLSNDYLDSPPSLAVLFKVCKKLKAETFVVKDHDNSAVILSDPKLQSTTSYFSGFCPAE